MVILRQSTMRMLASIVLCFYILSVFFVPVAQAYGFSTALDAYANNTVAGESTIVRTSQTDPHSDVVLEVIKPNGAILTLPITTDEAGFGKISLDSYHVQERGTYKVAAYTAGRSDNKNYTNFEVYAGKPVVTLSSVKASKYMASANGNDRIEVQVLLKDAYNNPVKDQQIKLISSRSEDVITQTNGNITNNQGTVVFEVSSLEGGMSTLSAMNLSSNEILNERLQVMFEKGEAMGGNGNLSSYSFLGASLLGDMTSSGTTTASPSLTAAKLKLSTVPTGEVKTGDLFDVVVDVTTADGKPAIDYKGTILFTSDDTNAILPTEYTFTGAEQPSGRKIFAKAARFITDGTKVLEVKDKLDTTLRDVVTIKNSTSGAVTGGITILSPQAGILTTKDVSISGKATALSVLKIFDNNDQIATINADAQGNFQTLITTLTEGTHVLSVKSFDLSGQVSAVSTPVSIVLQTASAWVKNVSIDPMLQTYTIGQNVKVTLVSDPGLLEAYFIIDGIKYSLVEDTMMVGSYKGQVTLPAKEGKYDTSIQMKNKLGVPGTVPGTTPIIVTAPQFPIDSVSFALSGDTTVNATWSAPTTSTGIGAYRIYYSVDAMQMKDFQLLSASATSHQFVGLAPNTTFYFKFVVMGAGENVILEGPVKALTTPDILQIKNAVAESQVGKVKVSWELAASSTKVRSFKILYGIAPNSYIKALDIASGTSALIDPLAEGKPHYIVIQGIGADGRPVLQSEEISATPLVGKAVAQTRCVPGDVQNLRVVVKDKVKYLVWDPAYLAEKYRIHAGTENAYYNLPAVEVSGTEYKIPQIDSKISAYYFAVTAICGEDGESQSYSNAVKVQSGPVALLLFTVALGGVFYYRSMRRKKVYL